MAFEKAKAHLRALGFEDRILVFEASTATVELAAQAVGTEPARIAKSLTFSLNGEPVMILCAGDAKVANAKYKDFFGVKAKMLTRDEVNALIGHDVGGVCPFGIPAGVRVYLDVSLKRFDIVYPACGSENSAVRLSIPELEKVSGFAAWIDVCKLPE